MTHIGRSQVAAPAAWDVTLAKRAKKEANLQHTAASVTDSERCIWQRRNHAELTATLEELQYICAHKEVQSLTRYKHDAVLLHSCCKYLQVVFQRCWTRATPELENLAAPPPHNTSRYYHCCICSQHPCVRCMHMLAANKQEALDDLLASVQYRNNKANLRVKLRSTTSGSLDAGTQEGHLHYLSVHHMSLHSAQLNTASRKTSIGPAQRSPASPAQLSSAKLRALPAGRAKLCSLRKLCTRCRAAGHELCSAQLESSAFLYLKREE